MRSTMHLVGRVGSIAIACAISAPLLVSTTALAQQRVVARSFVGAPGGGGSNQISTRSVEKYARLLKLTEDQAETVKALHEGYQAAFRDASTDMQKDLEEARQAFEETEDASVFAERFPAARQRFRERTTKAETEFFNDVKQILTESQLAAWPSVERARRRETVLRGGTLSGESVDLTEIVQGLNVSEPEADVVEVLNQYEVDLDRALLAKKAMLDAQGEFDFKPGAIDLSDIQKRSADAKEAGGKIKNVNEEYARKIEQLLPEDVRPAFGKAVKRQSFPRVYRPSQVSKAIDSALKFDDLDASQKDTLRSLRDSYEREVSPLNDAWAAAIEKDEQDPNNMALGDGSMQIKIGGPGGEEDESPLAKARKARREFDEKTRERLNAALSPAQRERLPKPTPGGAMGEMETEDEDVVVAPRGVFISR
ncbi:MAG: hypothetical protein GIKADHBN_01911 [Phycisphaerales bacterium]|nr:hypothetical protein [Phycisphaerales bacterium]